jgi:homoserine kinase
MSGLFPAPPQGLEILVPGSTSNLGPGFDALGLALRCYLRLRILGIGDGPPGTVTWRFGGPAPDGENYIERGFRTLAGDGLARVPALHVEVTTDIPMKAGLGSSAAALVAGFRLFEACAGRQPLDRLLDLAADLEGHPDNTSASLLGGFVASCRTRHGRVAAIATRWPADLRVVVATPAITLETKKAREVLPEHVPLADAVNNVQRAALLVQAVASGDRHALREAFHDSLHQPYRARLVPGLAQALAFEHPAVYGVFLSGAGPSIAAIVSDEGSVVRGMFEHVYRGLGLAVSVRTLEVHQPDEAAAVSKP